MNLVNHSDLLQQLQRMKLPIAVCVCAMLLLVITGRSKTAQSVAAAESAVQDSVSLDDEENRLAREYNDTLDFYARRFAGKQAVKKALDHFVDVSNFDYHDVEILDTSEGIMYVRMAKNLKAALEERNVGDFLISVTSEGDLATAIVMAQSL